MENNILNIDSLKTISVTINKLTHSGNKKIDVKQLREIFDICKINKGYVEHVFSRIMIILKENHSEVRLGAVLLCDHFFNSFAPFRELLVDSFETYFRYTLGVNFNQILPPPNRAADSLVKTSISYLNSWNSKFGKNYPKLLSTYNNLKNEKCVDFEKMEIYNPIDRAKKEKAESESLIINTSLLAKTHEEINDLENELNNSLTSLQTCFSLLIDFPLYEDGIEGSNSLHNFSNNPRLNGVVKPNHNMEICLESKQFIEIKINNENSAIIENAKEMHSLIRKRFLPKVKAWTVLIKKVGGNEDVLQKALDMEEQLETAIFKFNKLKFIDKMDEDSVSTDSDLEEVMEEIIVKEKVKMKDERQLFDEIEVKQRNKPGCSKSTKSYSQRKENLLKIAPKIPYSSDLYHWEDGKVSTETILPTATDGHRFWSSSSIDSLEVPAETSTLRVIEFSGTFEPVTQACKAPLPSGKLCPRHDRLKCPLHGIIVPRDDVGQIINKEDEIKVKKSKPQEILPDWQDPKLLAELKATTGLDLKVGKKKRKTKHPGLTDIKKKKSSLDRISKKIFKKSTMKKVNKSLDRLDYKRHRDKYGDQFNYVHIS